MKTLNKDSKICNVVVEINVDRSVREKFLELAEKNLAVFQTKRGFISGTILTSQENEKIWQVLQWESEADHKACVVDPSWAKEATAQEMIKLADKARWSPAVYSVWAQVGA